MPKDKLGENDKPDWSGPAAAKFDKYAHTPNSTWPCAVRRLRDCRLIWKQQSV